MSLKPKAFSLLFPAVPLVLLAAALPLSAQTERTVTKLAEGVYEIQHREGGGGVGARPKRPPAPIVAGLAPAVPGREP